MPKKHPHPPLRDLLQQVQNDAEVWLPSRLQSGPKSWLVRGLEGLPTLQLGVSALVAVSSVVALAQALWWVLGFALLAGVGLYHWRLRDPAHNEDLPLEWNGWRINVPQRLLTRVGAPLDEAAQAIDTLQLEPSDAWSVGLLPGDVQEHRAVYAWRLELRHRSRGPVATLCVLGTASGSRVVLQDVDALVDTLAQRLGIRRSGSRLLALPRARGAAAKAQGGA